VTPYRRSRIHLLTFGGMIFLLSALQLVTFYAQPSDIWWTPKTLSVPFANASDRVEIYVRDTPLQDQIGAGHLQLVSDMGASAVVGSEVRLRFNNWDRVRAQRLPIVISAAFCAGASSILLLFGILGRFPGKLGSTR
jgi:hypothetical protein